MGMLHGFLTSTCNHMPNGSLTTYNHLVKRATTPLIYANAFIYQQEQISKGLTSKDVFPSVIADEVKKLKAGEGQIGDLTSMIMNKIKELDAMPDEKQISSGVLDMMDDLVYSAYETVVKES